jgi:flagellar hook-length control protein FliK
MQDPTALAAARAHLAAAVAKLDQSAPSEPKPRFDDRAKSPQNDAQQTPKSLAEAISAARQHAAPAQTTTARALPLHIEAPSPDSGGNHQSGGEHQRQTANAGPEPRAIDAAADPRQPAAPAPSQTATQPPAQQAQPETQSIAGIPAAQAAEQGTRQVPVTLHVGPQSEGAAAQANLGTLAVNIAAKSKNGEKHFDIRLDPPELGRVEVKLSIDDAGKAQANLAVEKPHTLDLLQRDRSTLERALRDAGLDLAGGSLNFSLKGQERESNGPAPRSRPLSLSAIARDDSSIAISSHHLVAADSRLDIRV